MNQARLARVIANMARANLPCIIVSDPHSIYYLTGKFIRPGERMLALVVRENGDVRLFVNKLFALTEEAGLPLTEFDDTEDAIQILAAQLPAGRVGIDKNWAGGFLIRLMEARGDIAPALGSAPVDDARMIKDLEEIAIMRESSQMNDRALEKLIPTIRLGDTETDVGERYVKIARGLGGEGASFPPLVCFGKHCAEPHHASDDTRLLQDQAVILDLGLYHRRMASDMTRTIVFGRATGEMRRVYEIVKRANRAARDAARPGIEMREIDRAARSVIEEAGYGKYFIHRTGHGIGLEVHEPTDASANNRTVAQAGMVFSVEPGIYLPGKFGVRIEDLVALTEDGALTLNALDRELIEIV
ncbi:MAG: M24 family metallopeptidase [Christensenellales bacterium]|jgi:Xaa-Pro dipeptidase